MGESFESALSEMLVEMYDPGFNCPPYDGACEECGGMGLIVVRGCYGSEYWDESVECHVCYGEGSCLDELHDWWPPELGGEG